MMVVFLLLKFSFLYMVFCSFLFTSVQYVAKFRPLIFYIKWILLEFLYNGVEEFICIFRLLHCSLEKKKLYATNFKKNLYIYHSDISLFSYSAI